MKKALRRIVLLLIVIAILSFSYLYSSNFSHKLIGVKNRTVTSSKLPSEFDGFKIGFISDIYLKETADIERLQKIIDKLNRQNCDMIIFGGDLFETTIFDKEEVSKILSSATAEYGKFAILGEKDFIDLEETMSIIEDGGFELLRNTSKNIYYNNATINLIGLESSGDLSIYPMTNQFTMVAVHEPDYFAQTKMHSIDLQLSGHTSGGYIYLPYFGAIHTPVGGTIYNHGVYKEDGSTLIVSNGLGNESGQDYRLLTSPEIVVITLKTS